MRPVPIFYYHSIGGPPPQTLPLHVFLRHLDHLQRRNVHTVTVADIVARRLPDGPCAALAFDDGLLDSYENVVPALLERGMRATFYVVQGYDALTRWVNPRDGRWSDTAREGYTIPFASMQAHHRRELAAHGMEIGCHSATHRVLTRLSDEELAREVVDARTSLEQELGRAVTTFCYPKGRFNRRVLASVKRAGYAGACSTIPGYVRDRGSRFVLPRFLVEDPHFFEQVLRGRAFHPLAWPLSRLRSRWIA